MLSKDKADFIRDNLNLILPEPSCELEFSSNFEMLVAVILSAQCTDKRVNIVTRELFKKYNTPYDFANISQLELEELIHSCGFYHNKARNIINASRDIVEKFGGQVPSDFDDLCSLPGVGRKTANVVLSLAFGQDAIAVDTHVLRISNRLGIANTDNPTACEMELQKTFDKKDWTRLHYQFVLFGRYTCKAQRPDCKNCLFTEICKNNSKNY